ncbi:MAG: hypothetical protein EAZ10_17885 [Oscillatoriales cyanobacterium]|nr:MAG: hypothetical protein EAZ10_17885 [Oscillatoriales cyanobacterium]
MELLQISGWRESRNYYQKELVESRNPDREKLKSDYSLLQSSDLRVEVALKLSTVNCQLVCNYTKSANLVVPIDPTSAYPIQATTTTV